MSNKMEEYKEKLIEQCKKGIAGETKIEVKVMNMYLTNQCNIHCIMCPFISKDYPNKTYYNEQPHMVTLKEIKNILPQDKFLGIFPKKTQYEKKLAFNFFKGETLLNPHVFEIVKYIKEMYPKSEISILSNGTIPPKNPEIVKYIDVLGFSLDGGTQEIFEMIRTPAHFSHVVKSIEKWVEARNKYNPNLMLRTSTTLSTLNFFDLPNIVKTVGEIVRKLGGGWDSIYCQPVVIEEYQNQELNKITLEHVDKKQGKMVLEETKMLAQQYGVRLDIPQAIYQMFAEKELDESNPEDNKEYIEDNTLDKRVFCEKLSNGYLSYDLLGRIGFACCFMDKKYWREIIERYEIPDNKRPEEIYNSPGYWKLRKDLLEGKLKKECRNCSIGESNYYVIQQQINASLNEQE